MDHICPKCGAELEKVYGFHGIYEKCPSCDYVKNELEGLLDETSEESTYETPIDQMPPATRRHYMLSVSMTLKTMTYVEVVLILLTLSSLIFKNAYVSYGFLAITLIIALYLIRGYVKIRQRLNLEPDEQESIIIDMLNQEYQLKELKKTHKTKFGVMHAYRQYRKKLKKYGKPFRFATDPLYHDRIMTRVRKDTDMNRRIQIQNYKNELGIHYKQREEAYNKALASLYRYYGYHVYISFRLGSVIINRHAYSFDDVLEAKMTNHIYDDVVDEEVNEDDVLLSNLDVTPHGIKNVKKKEEPSPKKRFAFNESDSQKRVVKMCDAMNIIVKTRTNNEIVTIIDHPYNVKSQDYVMKQNDCYTVTGALRRAVRGSVPEDVPDLNQEETVVKESEAMEKIQADLIALLKTPVVYQVPEEYRKKAGMDFQ